MRRPPPLLGGQPYREQPGRSWRLRIHLPGTLTLSFAPPGLTSDRWAEAPVRDDSLMAGPFLSPAVSLCRLRAGFGSSRRGCDSCWASAAALPSTLPVLPGSADCPPQGRPAGGTGGAVLFQESSEALRKLRVWGPVISPRALRVVIFGATRPNVHLSCGSLCHRLSLSSSPLVPLHSRLPRVSWHRLCHSLCSLARQPHTEHPVVWLSG